MTDIHFAPTKKKIDPMSCNNVIKKKNETRNGNIL